MHEFIVEVCQTAFQWGSLAVIVGAVSLRYWQSGQADGSAPVPRKDRIRRRPRPADHDMSWVSLSEPADGGVSGRDPLSAMSLKKAKHTPGGQRLA